MFSAGAVQDFIGSVFYSTRCVGVVVRVVLLGGALAKSLQMMGRISWQLFAHWYP